ncbi:HIT family protein [Clostridium gasigenes]|uniref:Scavenger mRNA decapping enzyme C-term binding n=1 Tax=Clostridium gasigenes TaxID=94869 RepID=A0A1H0RKK1_9CLOT|nr:HIT domain-containing protein [Clostridium gasigenes]MBU3087899.1 HIT domain-containing protein [Clostridium gasigenes]SDP30052.1 Scavenger mRNA decapping enzyme C-term binding [Clostridium gasigenes]
MENKDCVFCKIVNKEAPSNIIYEDELVCCFLDIDPIKEGHVIVPKELENKNNLDSVKENLKVILEGL